LQFSKNDPSKLNFLSTGNLWSTHFFLPENNVCVTYLCRKKIKNKSYCNISIYSLGNSNGDL